MSRIVTLLLFLSLAAGTTIQAQNTGNIEGQVFDAQNMEALAGVNLVLRGTSYGTASDANGNYRIANVPAGSYTLRVTFLGFEEHTQPVEVRAGETLRVDIELNQTILRSEELVVTGSRRPEKLLDAPMSIETITAENLDQTGGGTFYQALANLKGVDFVDAGINAQGISARGFASHFNTRLLQMVDGRMAQLPGTGLPQGNFLPNSDLDLKGIEVVLGPASALYGPNAHTGVVNVLTKDPWDESGVGVSLRGGQQSLFDATYRLAGTVNDKFGWKITGQHLRADDFEPRREDGTHFYGASTVFESDVIDDYSISSDKVDGALYYRLGDWELKGAAGWSENTNFGLTNNGRNHIRDWQVNYQQFQVSHPNWYAQIARTENDAGGTYQLNQVVPAVQAQVNAGASLDDINYEALRDAFGFTDKGKVLDTEVQYRNAYKGVEFVTGVQYRNYTPNSEGTFLADAVGRDLDMEELGGYLQLDYRFMDDKMKAVVAGRYDTHSNYDSQFSPKVALVYTVAPGHNVRATYNKAFKSPSVIESFIYIPIDVTAVVPGYYLLAEGNIDGFEIRNPAGETIREIKAMVPEEVNSFELGYKGVYGSKLFVDVVGYYSWYTDFISPLTTVADGFAEIPYDASGNQIMLDQADFTGLLTYFNFGEAEVRGMDFGLNYYFTDEINASFSVSLIERVNFESESGDEFLLNVPETKIKGGVTFGDLFGQGSFVNISSRWNSAYKFRSGYWNSEALLPDGEVPSRFVTDITAGYQIPNTGLKAKVSASNVFNNERIPVLGAPVRERLVWLSLTYKLDGLRF